jgi:hypothetical protein
VTEHGARRFLFCTGTGGAGVEVIATWVQAEPDLEVLVAGNADVPGGGQREEAPL